MKKVLLTLSSVILLIGFILFLLYPKNNFEKEINNEIAEEIKTKLKQKYPAYTFSIILDADISD